MYSQLLGLVAVKGHPHDPHGSILKSTFCVNINYMFKSRVDLRRSSLKINVIKGFFNLFPILHYKFTIVIPS